MSHLLLDPMGAIVATVLMVIAGMGKRRFAWRSAQCPVCHNAKSACTCRWL